MATRSRKKLPNAQNAPKAPALYDQVIEAIFAKYYRPGVESFEFDREEIETTARLLHAQGKTSKANAKNLGDVVYTFRHRKALPESVRRAAPEGRGWLILGAGDARYRGFVGFGASFGGGWWNGFARRRTTGGKVAKAQPHEEAARSCSRLLGLDITFTLADYTSTPDHVLVYADPPYQGTEPYKGAPAFDHAAFWSWVRRRQGPTFVSELSGPDDIDIVWRKQHKSQNASNSPTTKATAKVIEREERLYWHRGGWGLWGGEEAARMTTT